MHHLGATDRSVPELLASRIDRIPLRWCYLEGRRWDPGSASVSIGQLVGKLQTGLLYKIVLTIFFLLLFFQRFLSLNDLLEIQLLVELLQLILRQL